MKKIMLMAVVALSTSVMADYSELSVSECTRVCELYTYNFTPDFLGQCGQVEKCDLLKWDETADVCTLDEADVLVTYPMQCRDIPAL